MTVAGLNQLGAPFFVEPLFNGSMLILAVGLAVQARNDERSAAARPIARRPPRRSPRPSQRRRRDDERSRTRIRRPSTTRPAGLIGGLRRGVADDQRGDGNLMSPAKVLEASRLIKTGEIVSLGHPYEATMPLAPGRAFALRMPGGPTGGPYGERQPDDLERRIPQHRDRPDRHAYGRARPSRLSVRRQGRPEPICCSTTAIA